MTDTRRRSIAARSLAGALILAAMATTSAGVARAAEFIPSIGLSKSTDTNAGNAEAFGGLAIRMPVLPFLKLEGGIAYRQDSFSQGKIEQWPVTVSAWVAPFPIVYVGGGLGWYRTTYNYDGDVPIKDTTSRVMGVHLGGGAELPIAPHLGLDLNGRYVFMQKDANNVQVPTSFNPDFWNLTLGLAINF